MSPHVPAPRRFRHRLLTLLGGVLLAGSATAQAPATDTLTAQRTAFRQAWTSATQQGGNGWRALATNLRDYPLYPYLPAAALEHDIRQVDLPTVQAYLKQYPELIPAQDLRRNFLEELARRKDWQGFRTLYQPGINLTLTCDALQAKLADGTALNFQQDLAALWQHASLPNACDPVLQAAHDQGLLTDARLWARIDRAFDADKGGTVAALAGWLPDDQRQTALKLAQALRDPAAAATAAAQWPDTVRLRQAAATALQRLARRAPDTANTDWQTLQHHFHFSSAQRNAIRHAVVLFRATDFEPDSLSQLIALPAAAQSDATREWRVRVALAQQDWRAVLAGIEAMPAEQQNDDEWRYFRARALTELGHADTAQPLFQSLAGQATYFGFLAADRIGAPYAICPLQPTIDPQREPALLAMPGLQRAFELYAVDLPRRARREWSRALAGADAATRALAADLANRRGWYDRAVFTFSHGDMLHYYDLRFPLARQDGLVAQADEAGIDPAWAYGILRAESAWMTDAHSGADARGLMQLLPDTAAGVAKRNGLAWGGGDTLYDPAVNIALGTRHLAELDARFGDAPWLASAAYNAGSAKVKQWLGARGSLTPDVFVATIPYKETREYVARVMAFSVIYDWRLHGKVLPMSARMPAFVDPPDGQPQPAASPAAHAARKTVDCPASETPAPATSAPAGATSARQGKP
ncbi:transglycosylase SLT domain-containing protein [Rhodanobacter sp. 115]|uniref:transglycosylase SLT domain-containing protein n=1 Tax=Rhodanobacter sp. FW021-MT20 TaxID=1162282 RepID=UPI0034E41DE2